MILVLVLLLLQFLIWIFPFLVFGFVFALFYRQLVKDFGRLDDDWADEVWYHRRR